MANCTCGTCTSCTSNCSSSCSSGCSSSCSCNSNQDRYCGPDLSLIGVTSGTLTDTVIQNIVNYLSTNKGSISTFTDNNNRTYTHNDGNGVIKTITLDGNNVNILRTDATESVAPTTGEVASPISGDTATIRLSNGLIEFWNYTTAWARLFKIDPVTLDGNNVNVLRTNTTEDVAPTAGEVASPIAGDSAIIKLSNETVEFWNYTTAWNKIFKVAHSAAGFAADQVLAIGATTTVTHNLNTTDVIVQVKDPTNKFVNVDEIFTTGVNTITLKANVAGTYRVLVRPV